MTFTPIGARSREATDGPHSGTPSTGLNRRAVAIAQLSEDIALRRPRYAPALSVFWTGHGQAAPDLNVPAAPNVPITETSGFVSLDVTCTAPDGRTVTTPALTLTGPAGRRWTVHPEVAVLLAEACLAWLDRDVSSLDVILGPDVDPASNWTSRQDAVTTHDSAHGPDPLHGPGRCTLRRGPHLVRFSPRWTETHVTVTVQSLTHDPAQAPERWVLRWTDLPALCAALRGVNRAYLQNAVPALLNAQAPGETSPP